MNEENTMQQDNHDAAQAAAPVTSNESSPLDVITFMTSAQVADAIRAAGCAVSVQQDDLVTRLHSASHGIGYQVHWGNQAGVDQYLDLTLSCPLRIQGGDLPEGLINEWHRSRRFARVAAHGEFLVLEMDVFVAGGVTSEFLRFSMRLWVEMMGQFFLHLRNFTQQATGQAAAPRDDLATPGDALAGVDAAESQAPMTLN
ncbi:YbjN domain-containing protein [Pandoraea commovens]|uniref:YbjN domain-containing protein n=1 Tax=Pandoraea commovens TaxID=2508289 RepID=A0A5E4Z773_9BURK|nr:YbjN domain-containing protein [Pandoraea commovens]UVA80579.1 YbjN domain-containing protein [Pandoraea commovens]VVE56999.1 YbjN domain-containing protein [Pandoraea commovens]